MITLASTPITLSFAAFARGLDRARVVDLGSLAVVTWVIVALARVIATAVRAFAVALLLRSVIDGSMVSLDNRPACII